MIGNITIYGATTDIDGSIATKTQVQALSGVAHKEYEVFVINGEPAFEFDEIEFLGGAVKSGIQRSTVFKPEMKPMSFPESSIDLDTYYGSNVLMMPYLWVDFGTYKIRHAGITSDNLLKIALTDFSVEHSSENGTKQIKMEFKAR